jgi:hypothetical protein
MDEERKQQVEMFLGWKGRSYFPTLHLPYRCAGAAGGGDLSLCCRDQPFTAPRVGAHRLEGTCWRPAPPSQPPPPTDQTNPTRRRDDAPVAGDYPDSDPDDEKDPLGFLSWPQQGGGAAAAAAAAAVVAAVADRKERASQVRGRDGRVLHATLDTRRSQLHHSRSRRELHAPARVPSTPRRPRPARSSWPSATARTRAASAARRYCRSTSRSRSSGRRARRGRQRRAAAVAARPRAPPGRRCRGAAAGRRRLQGPRSTAAAGGARQEQQQQQQEWR